MGAGNQHRIRGARGRAGFTLVELMLAIGILGVGLVMIGTAFPSAMLENKQSMDDTMATLVGQNAVAIARTRLRHSALAGAQWETGAWVDTALIPQAEQSYAPLGEATRFGYLMKIKRLQAGRNDYALAILPYRKFRPSDTVDLTGSRLDFTVVSAGPPPVVVVQDGYQVILKNASGTAYADSAHIGCFVARTCFRP